MAMAQAYPYDEVFQYPAKRTTHLACRAGGPCELERYTARFTRIRERGMGAATTSSTWLKRTTSERGLHDQGNMRSDPDIGLLGEFSAACSPTTTAVSNNTASKTRLNQGTNASDGGGGGGGGY